MAPSACSARRPSAIAPLLTEPTKGPCETGSQGLGSSGNAASGRGGSPPGLGGEAQIGLERLPALGELLLGLVVRDRGHDDDVLALLPVDGRRDLMLGRQLDGI